MFDFEKFGSTSTSNPTKPEEQKKGSTFNFDSFGSAPETTTPTNPVAGGINVSGTNQAPSEDTEPGFARKAFDLFTSSEQGFGESIGQAINTQLYAKEAEQNNARYMKAGNDMLALAKKTLDPIKKETYLNQSQKYFDQAGRGIQDIIGGEIKTTGQVVGEAAGTALDAVTMGTYGAAAKTAISGVKMAKPALEAIPTVISKLSSEGIKEAGKKVGIGTGIGYGYDVSFNLQNQEHEDGISILTPGFATLIGAGLPSLGFAYGAAKEIVKGKPLETVVKAGMEKGVKPSVAGKQTLGKIDEYHQKAADAVKSIVNYKDNLKFVDPVTGDEIVGELPKTLEQFGAAIEQTKKAIFSEYDALAKATGKQGNVVTFDSLLPELEKAANDTVLNLKDPHAAAYAADMVEKFKQLQQLTPEQAQQYITQMNADLQSFYRNPTYGTSSKVGIDVLIVNNMRKALDTVIESATGKEYQKLKSMYGSLKAIEKDVNHRAVVDARKNNATLVDYSNIFTYGDIAKGLISMDPATVAKGMLGKGLQVFYKWRNDPNVLIKEMFEKGEKAIKNNVPSKPPVEIKSNKGFIDTMFPQEGKESPSEVMKTILDKTKNMPAGMSIKDVSGGKAGYEGVKKNLDDYFISKKEIEKIKEEDLIPTDLYHVSPLENLNSIKEKGLTKSNTTQNFKGDARANYFTNSYEVVKNMQKKLNKDTFVLRYKNNRDIFSRGGPSIDEIEGDSYFFGKNIKSKNLEILTSDGWKSLVDPSIKEVIFKQNTKHNLKTSKIKTKTILDRGVISSKELEKQRLLEQKALQSIFEKSKQFIRKTPYTPGPLTTKLLKKLEGRSTVSKTFISDLTNAPDLKQTEKDVIRQVLQSEGDKVNVADFGKKVEAELLPLERKKWSSTDRTTYSPRYESVSLPDELRGEVKNYQENIYKSPIATSAGDVHFNGEKNYFGHTRVEDLPDNKTRRVIEVQSDLYQKGRLESEGYSKDVISKGPTVSNKNKTAAVINDVEYKELSAEQVIKNNDLTKIDYKTLKDHADSIREDLKDYGGNKAEKDALKKWDSILEKIKTIDAPTDFKDLAAKRDAEIAKLQQYNNPTAHFRMVREEIKRAADDGVEKVQFPTGETGMKIEGLGRADNFRVIQKDKFTHTATVDELKVGLEGQFNQGGDSWIITDVLGDGKFKAVPKRSSEALDIEEFNFRNSVDEGGNGEKFSSLTKSEQEDYLKSQIEASKETFDISGKVDQNNPIYKFYEKELGRYLKNNFDAKLVTDKQGVNWMEVTVKPEHKGPVTAFGASNLAGMTAGLTTILGLGVAANKESKPTEIKRRTVIDKPFITERRDGAKTSKSEDLLSELLDKYTIKKPIANNTKTKTIIDGVDVAPYATDKDHESHIKQHMKTLEGIDTPEKINAEIERISTSNKKESILKGMGETIIKITKHYNIPLTLFLAVLKQDTSLGVNNLSKNNPGNIANDDTGKKTDFDTIEEGLVAAARYLANNKS